jgi:hypothetical protein
MAILPVEAKWAAGVAARSDKEGELQRFSL